ncbi:LysR family transcriptional regulator [Stenotrophomonas sp. HITSZ_GD]|uniref:LysR family transcriptional regulator n=1 Tax=Stenotrophomonas sp. HITSZ_GD TaxID=3037248 RepID=UPI00240D4B3C|nr:LysR family transcriptional regulator [Stenotrophomonas sp. HITSZ_GD]MDG2523860.1 LysR family transcriptional regulator [Stenotrophomonas sp. HITSZ_GD]
MKTTLDEMQAFLAVIDTGSITAAAEALQQTVSAVSRALGRLEEKLGVTLLTRTTRRLRLTEEGEAFLAQARAIVSAVEAAEEQMAARRERPAGRLRVDAATSFLLHVIVPRVPGYRALYPDVQLELNGNERNIDLVERRTDLAFRIGPLGDSSLHARPVGRSRLRVLASPDYLARHGTPGNVDALLREHTLIGFRQPESLKRWPLADAGGEPVTVEPHVAAASGETLLHLARAGTGITCLSDFMTASDRASGQLVQVLAEQTLDMRQPINAVYYRNTAVSARITSFLDYLAQSLGETPFEA